MRFMGTHYRPCLVANISQILILDFVRFDIYDWVPIFAVLFVTAIVLNTIFPNRSFFGQDLAVFSFSCKRMPTTMLMIFLFSLFLTGQQLTLFGRKEGRR